MIGAAAGISAAAVAGGVGGGGSGGDLTGESPVMANGTLTFDWLLPDSNAVDCVKMKVVADGGLEGGVGNRCSGLAFEVPAAGAGLMKFGQYSLVVDSGRGSTKPSVTGVAVAVEGAAVGKAPSADGLRKYDDVLPGHPSSKATSNATENSPGITNIQIPSSHRPIQSAAMAAKIWRNNPGNTRTRLRRQPHWTRVVLLFIAD